MIITTERQKSKFLIGVDEAGRGPLAGPVAVAAVLLRPGLNLDKRVIKAGLRDSKALSAKKREWWFAWLKHEQSSRRLRCVSTLVGEKIIDRQGIVSAVNLGIRRVLRRLKIKPENCQVLLDGSLRAPIIFTNQQTIIKGDSKIPIIMLASIAAKVRRDRRLARLAHRYPGYGFEIHKGYGTRAHYAALRRQGPSPIHRHSFL